MTDLNPPGKYIGEWQKTTMPTLLERFKCRKCASQDISFRFWESDCGGYEDVHYRCDASGFDWWVESADA